MNSGTKKTFYTGLFLATTLGALLIAQTQLKFWPQVSLILLAILTAFSVKKGGRIGIWLISILISFGTICIVFGLFEIILDVTHPNRGTVPDVEGEMRRVMDISWLWTLPIIALVLPYVLKKYLNVRHRDKKAEIISLGLFTVCSGLIFFLFELI